MSGDILARVAEASMRGHQGDAAGARAILDGAWHEATEGPAIVRVAVAHALADVQESPTEERSWDERALAEADRAADEPTPDGLPPVAALLPSLHLNLADVNRRLGAIATARDHAARAHRALAALGPDAAQPHLADALDRVEGALRGPPRGCQIGSGASGT